MCGELDGLVKSQSARLWKEEADEIESDCKGEGGPVQVP